MIEELRQKVGQFEQELQSWSAGSSSELKALQENMEVIEKHIRQQQKLLGERQETIANLTQENKEMREIIDNLVQSTENLIKSGHQTSILELKERSSELIDAASAMEKTSNSPAAAGPKTSSSPVVVESKPQTEPESNKSDEQSPSKPDPSGPGESSAADSERDAPSEDKKAADKRTPNANSYEGKDRFDGLIDEVERLMSKNGSH